MKHKVIGYGSLISHKSLSKTIPDKKFKLIIIKGYKRIFNLAIKKSGSPNVLNIQKSSRSKLNAVLFKITNKELLMLKKREAAYDTEETQTYDFTSGKKLGNAYIFTDYFIAIDKRKRSPNKNYFVLCREAAYHINEKYGKFWDNTTYTSSGKKVKDWIKKNPKYDSIK